jgi:hypothetical protein
MLQVKIKDLEENCFHDQAPQHCMKKSNVVKSWKQSKNEKQILKRGIEMLTERIIFFKGLNLSK